MGSSTLFSNRAKTTDIASVLLLVTALVLGGFFISVQQAHAAHTAAVAVSPTLVKGGATGTYTFNITNNGADAIYRVIVAIPSGFTSIASASCPAGMTASEVSSTQVICLGDSFEPSTQIANGASAQVSFGATSPTPGSDTLYTWSVTTRDTTGESVPNTSAQTNVDVTVPTISSITTKDTNGDGRVETATILFSEAVDDSTFAPNDFTIGGSAGTSIAGTADDNTLDVVVSGGVAGTEAKDVTYTKSAGAGADMVGNLLANVASGDKAEVDEAKPRLMSAQTVSVTSIVVVFSEDIDGGTVNTSGSEFSLSAGSISAASETSPGVVTLTVSTMTTGATPDVTFTNTGSFKDLNNNQAVTPTTVTAVDGIAPTFTSTRTGLNTIVLTFSENVDVTTTDGSGYTLSAGTVTANTDPAGITNTITLTTSGLTGTSETPTVTYGATAGTTVDGATNEAVDGASAVASDGVAPTVTITSTATSPTKNSPIPMTATFSESVTGFDSSEVTVGNGTAGNFAGSGTTYTFDVTPTGQGAVTADIAGAVAKDAADNNNATAAQFSITYDSVAPTVELTKDHADLIVRDADTVVITATFSEAMASAPTISIDAVTNDITAAAMSGAGTTWTYSWNVPSGNDGAAVVTVAGTDIATNPYAGATNVTFTIDNTNPTPVLEMTPIATPDNNNTPNIVIKVENNVGWVIKNVETVINIGTGTGDDQTVTLNTLADGLYDLTLSATDTAGNTASSALTQFRVDMTNPAVEAGVDKLSNAQFTQDATASDGGSGIATYAWNKVSGTGTITFGTPAAEDTTISSNTDGVFVISLTVTDNAGNSANDDMTLTWDTTAPTVGIVLADTALKAGDTSLVTITFSEAVTGFDNTDITTIDNGTLTSVSSADSGVTWTATFTPTAGIEDTSNIITVTKTGVVDLAGNAGVGTTSSGNYAIDNVAPTATQVTPVTTPTNDTTPDIVVNVEFGATWQIKNSETVLASGTGNSASQTATLSALTAGTYSLNLVATDAAGNITTTALTAFTVDTTNPAVSITSPTADSVTKGTSITLASSASDASGVTCKYQVDGGILTTIDCSGGTIGSLTDGRRVIALVATDGAGNSASDQISVVIDTDDTLTVNGAGGADFTTIRAAITAAIAGDTINIAAGDYAEPITIDKSLTLTGTGSPTTTSFTLTNGAVVSGSSGITASNVYVNQTGGAGAKIQDGILLASSGGTITVGAGTYTGEITVTKSLTINGANAGVAGNGTRVAESIIDGSDVTSPVDKGFIVSAGNLIVTVDGFMFTDNSPLHDNYASGASRTTDITFRNNIVSSGNALQTTDPTSNWRDVIVTRNKFENIDMEPIASAVDLNYNRSSVVTDNVFTNISYAAIQVFSNDTATISGNTITTTGKKGIQLAGAMGASTVSNNVISGANSSSSADYGGIRFYGADFTGTVNVTGNTVSGSFNGIAIKDGQNITGKDINVSNNNLADNANKSVYHGGTGTLDATKNWYGTADGTTIASKISGTVDYRPWYLSLADLNSSTLDQVAPTVALTYSANPAKAGVVTITATYSEVIVGTPQISVDQQGATDVSNAAMSGSGAVWTYAYTVNTATGGTYVDGTATVSLSSVNDPSGNIAGSPTGTTFTIDTAAPNAPIITSIATDNKINDSEKTAIVVVGTAVADSLVMVSLTNGVTVTGTQQLSSGATAYSITIDGTSLTDGTVTPSVTATDVAGNVSTADTDPTALKDTLAPAFTINDGTATGPVKNDTINVTVTEVNPDTIKYGFSADNVCNSSDTISTDFTSATDFSIAGNHVDYLCAKVVDTVGNETYQLVGQLNTDNTNPALVLGSLFTDQTLNGGLSYSINWTASDLNFSGTPIKLEYSIDGGSTWTTIIASTEDDGVYNWSVPTAINSSSAKIQITATDTATNSASAESNTFTIVYVSDTTPPVVTLNSPNGGESWVGGSSHVITWTATDNVTAAGSLTIKLEYSTNGSTSWTTIIASTNNDGAYLWTVPDSASTNMLVKVTATDAATNAGSDLSNAVFTTTAAPAHICTDAGGGNWTCTIALNTGWNLISLPVIVSNTAIATVLSGVVDNMARATYWNGSAWVDYVPDVTTALTTIEDGKGYWINMTGSDTLTVTGTKAPAAPDHAPTYSVASGWNLVGFKSTITQLSATYLSNLSSLSYTLLNASNENKNSGNMDAGKGYWLWMSGAGSIVTSSETE